MAARAAMATIILAVRALLNDPQGSRMILDDDTIEDALDSNSQQANQAQLIEIATVNATTKAYEYLKYRAAWGYWESSPVLQDSLFATITPSASDLLRGVWTLSASKDPPCYITGAVYDIYAAAADCLDIMIARAVTGGWDEINARYSAPKRDAADVLDRLAQLYRKRSWPNVTTVTQP